LAGWIVAAWRFLPVFVRAIIVGLIVNEIGSDGSAAALFGNLKLHPEIPWALPAVLVLCVLFWAYFSGWGFPAATRASRAICARKGPVPIGIWLAALPAMTFGITTLITLRLVGPYVLPVAAPHLKLDLSPYPALTVYGILLSIAVSAAVTEEFAYRGYMQQPMEVRYGIAPAILISGVMFWVAHLPDVTVTHLPGHLAASAVFGLLAYYTRSLWPAVVAHAISDFVLQPAYLFHAPQSAWAALSARPLWEGAPTTVLERFSIIGAAMRPENVLSGPHQIFATLAWAFCASSLLTVLGFYALRRASRRMAT
jgi:membrane protease YdiL (CAAX protease family)